MERPARRLPDRRDGALHRRDVVLDSAERTLTVTDQLEGSSTPSVRIAFHLGPQVQRRLDGDTARLEWPGGSGAVELPAQLTWRAHRGETEPVLGWYSGRVRPEGAGHHAGRQPARPSRQAPLVSAFHLRG